jgi:predicted O-methyltransferase YrrM
MDAIKKRLKLLLMVLFNHVMDQHSKNIARWRQQNALRETGEFVDEFMSGIQSSGSRYELMTQCCQQIEKIKIEGMICEFGVAAGKSVNYISTQLPNRKIYGFDSFEGLPESWRDGTPKGTFRVQKLPKVAANVELIQGWFDQTLPEFLAQHPEPVALLHIDCDLYSSTKTVFNLLKERIRPGTVIVFDEYFNYPGWKKHEFLAFQEFITEHNLAFEYIGYNRYGTQAAVVIK